MIDPEDDSEIDAVHDDLVHTGAVVPVQLGGADERVWLDCEGVRAAFFVDIDPRKVGGVARGAPVVAPEGLSRASYTVVVVVGARGARGLVRAWLAGAGFVEGEDFVCAA